jgi:hypothetical protein
LQRSIRTDQRAQREIATGCNANCNWLQLKCDQHCNWLQIFSRSRLQLIIRSEDVAIETGLLALAYALGGEHFWEAKVMRPVSNDDLAECADAAAMITLIEGNAFLHCQKRDATLAYFILKGVFVLAWPMWLFVGFVRAKVAKRQPEYKSRKKHWMRFCRGANVGSSGG